MANGRGLIMVVGSNTHIAGLTHMPANCIVLMKDYISYENCQVEMMMKNRW